MKKMLTALWLPMALSLAIAAGAAPKQSTQNPQSGQSGSYGQSSQSGMENSAHKVTLTGCLQAGTEPNTWILTNATTSSAKGSSSSEAPSEMARAESSYVLVPESGIDLSKHVGHRVRVTGSIEEGSSSTPSTSSGSTGATGSQSASNMTRFDVKSIKHVANTCQ